jgi:hypothetical protein
MTCEERLKIVRKAAEEALGLLSWVGSPEIVSDQLVVEKARDALRIALNVTNAPST